MRVSDNRYLADRRRIDLARRFIVHEARTRTIAKWTGLSPHTIRTLHQSYTSFGSAACIRHRGVPPYLLRTFFRSPELRNETAILAGLCYGLQVLPRKEIPRAGTLLPSVERGERLCDAYDVLRAFMPSALSIDHAALLVIALARGEEIKLGRCASCPALIVIDCAEPNDRWCGHCLVAAVTVSAARGSNMRLRRGAA